MAESPTIFFFLKRDRCGFDLHLPSFDFILMNVLHPHVLYSQGRLQSANGGKWINFLYQKVFNWLAKQTLTTYNLCWLPISLKYSLYWPPQPSLCFSSHFKRQCLLLNQVFSLRSIFHSFIQGAIHWPKVKPTIFRNLLQKTWVCCELGVMYRRSAFAKTNFQFELCLFFTAKSVWNSANLWKTHADMTVSHCNVFMTHAKIIISQWTVTMTQAETTVSHYTMLMTHAETTVSHYTGLMTCWNDNFSPYNVEDTGWNDNFSLYGVDDMLKRQFLIFLLVPSVLMCSLN